LYMYKKKGKPAFLANEGNIGGAHMILADYVNLHGRAASAKPDHDILAVRRSAAEHPRMKCTPGAAQLSQNRQARLATTDRTAVEHVHNVHHMIRRIEDMYSVPARRKNPHDPTVHPVMLRRHREAEGSSPHRHRPSLHQALVDPWLQGQGYSVLQPGALSGGRPGSAPHEGYLGKMKPVRGDGRDGYQGWSVGPSLRDLFPSDDFPLYRQPPPQLSTDYAIYKNAIMSEIVERRMYRELTLRRLFHKYIKLAPLRDKHIVEHVVADLKIELGIV